MSKIFFVLLLAMFVPAALMVLFFFVSTRVKSVRDDNSPFECGFDPKSLARTPFSLRFFLLAVVFLIFDVEVALLFPLCYSLSMAEKGSVVIILFVFLSVVLLGLFLEWKEGALDWVS